MKKNILKFILFLTFSGIIFAEENVEQNPDESFMLPDVSTVIYGGDIKVGKSAIPDYSEILPENAEVSDEINLELPEIENDKNLQQKAEVLNNSEEKSIFAEGIFGAGYPGLFLGNFTVYRSTKNPFKINFNHESSSGYASNSVNDGYFDKKTVVLGEKSFNFEKIKLNFSGSYKNLSDGFQNQSKIISDITKNVLFADVNLLWNIKNGFYFDFDINSEWYNRYANLVGEKSEKDLIEKWLKGISVLSIKPEFNFGWKNNNFNIFLNGEYFSESDLNKSFIEEKNLHRGNFLLNFDWKNSFINLFADFGVAFGNYQNENGFILPFKVGTKFQFETPISARKFNIMAVGGLKSETLAIGYFEEKYNFSALNNFVPEISDWFANYKMIIPVKDLITLNFDAEFLFTAFKNGIYEPNFEQNSLINTNNLFVFERKELTQFNTNLGFSFAYGIFNFDAFWKCFWSDVPLLEYKNSVNLAFAVQSKNAKIGFDGKVLFNMDKNYDTVPVVDFSVFFRVTSAIRLALNMEDIVKLITSTERIYAGNFVKRSGCANFVVKFNF